MPRAAVVVVMAVCAVSSACAPGPPSVGPLESLKGTELSSEYGEVFWYGEASAETDLWREALELCREPSDVPLPNCGVLRQATFLARLEREADKPFPTYGEGGGSTGVPEALEPPVGEVPLQAVPTESVEDPS